MKPLRHAYLYLSLIACSGEPFNHAYLPVGSTRDGGSDVDSSPNDSTGGAHAQFDSGVDMRPSSNSGTRADSNQDIIGGSNSGGTFQHAAGGNQSGNVGTGGSQSGGACLKLCCTAFECKCGGC